VLRLVALFLAVGCTPSNEGLDPTSVGGSGNAPVLQTPPGPDANVAGPDNGDGPAGSSGGAGPFDTARNDSAPDSVGPARPCAVIFTVTTTSYGGEYEPANAGAIWIADASARFVKTLTVWASTRRKALGTWNSVSGGNIVDAVTGATARSHGVRVGTWNCTGVDRRTVPDGLYRVYVEFTEANFGGRLLPVADFNKGGGPVDLNPPDQRNFKGIHLQVIQ
jgi:hypothetical protein